jgi:hypothetical protein
MPVLIVVRMKNHTRANQMDFAGCGAAKDGIHHEGLHQLLLCANPPLISSAAFPFFRIGPDSSFSLQSLLAPPRTIRCGYETPTN